MQPRLFKVRDRRQKGWFYLDNEYLNGYAKIFGAIGTAIYVSLCRHADNETQECFPSMELIGSELSISRNTITKYIRLFEQYRLITVEREKDNTGKWKNNTYFLLDKSEWTPHAQPLGTVSHAQPMTEPCTTVDKNHAQPLGNKETHINYTHRTRLTSATRPKKGVVFTPLGAELLKAFGESVDPKNKTYYSNTTQRGACDFLIAEYGYERVLGAVKALPQINQQKLYLRQITTPYELKENWVKIVNAFAQKKNDTKYKVAF